MGEARRRTAAARSMIASDDGALLIAMAKEIAPYAWGDLWGKRGRTRLQQVYCQAQNIEAAKRCLDVLRAADRLK